MSSKVLRKPKGLKKGKNPFVKKGAKKARKVRSDKGKKRGKTNIKHISLHAPKPKGLRKGKNVFQSVI